MKPFMLKFGGKASIARWIVSHLPEHEIYAEPFGGSLAVLLQKPRSSIEWVNDLDKQAVNIWRQIKENPKELAALLWATPWAFDEWKEQPPLDASQVEIALQAILESKQCYSGNEKTRTWRAPGFRRHIAQNAWDEWFRRVLPASVRMKGVTLFNEDALVFIKRIADKKNALLYVDPPYVGHEDSYHHKIDYPSLIDILEGARSQVIVSEESEGAKHWPARWERIHRKQTTRGGRATSEKKEILIIKPRRKSPPPPPKRRPPPPPPPPKRRPPPPPPRVV